MTPPEPLLAIVPRPMRHWPILRRWYWQEAEVNAIHERANARWLALQDLTDPPPSPGDADTQPEETP